MPRALITGVTGQDGSYLAELLLALDYDVWGFARHRAEPDHPHLVYAKRSDRFRLLTGDLLDASSIEAAVMESEPDEVYHLAGHTFVGDSWDRAEHVFMVNCVGTQRVLRAVEQHAPSAKFYQASTSEMFGNAPAPQSEATPFSPCSPYGVAKLAAHQLAVDLRERGKLWVSCGIAFNHESPRRGREFVTSKLASYAVADCLADRPLPPLKVGNLIARRDWGHARDVVYAMRSILALPEPGDYVIGTGVSTSVLEFAQMLGIAPDRLDCDPACMRPREIMELRADARKLRGATGWSPSVTVEELADEMFTELAAKHRQDAACDGR